MKSQFISVLALVILLTAFSCFSQDLDRRLSTIQDPHFEIVGSENLGRYKSSKSESDTLSVIVVHVSTKYVRRSHLSKFIPKIKSKLTGSESFFVYFMDDRDAEKLLLQLVKLDTAKDTETENKFIRSIKALFVYLKNDKKEFLRLFQNGMTDKDFSALALELKH